MLNALRSVWWSSCIFIIVTGCLSASGQFGLTLKPRDHFPHHRNHVAAIRAVRYEVAAILLARFAERKHEQDEAGLAFIAFGFAVQDFIEALRDGVHRRSIFLPNWPIAQTFRHV